MMWLVAAVAAVASSGFNPGAGYTPPKGCPYPAIGFIAFASSDLHHDAHSFGSGSYVDTQSMEQNDLLTVRYWRPHPKAQALVVMDLRTRKAYATTGTVKKFGNVWCAFSE